MGLMLRLVETGADTRARGIGVLELDQCGDLCDITNLGLMLPEAKPLLARVQQAVVATQARDHAALRPDCSSCGARCHVKDWRSRQVATLFGAVAVRLPRFRCPGCGHSEAGTSWPAHGRSTPELYQDRASESPSLNSTATS
jgi:transposase